MTKKELTLTSDEIGLCTKSKDGRVISKNEACSTFCNNCVGNKCTDGCMKLYQFETKENSLQEGINLFRNSEINGHALDVAMIFDGVNLTSLLYPLERKYGKEIEELKTFKLSPRETQVVEQLIRGKTNSEIAKSLFISTVTLKTHLNNIYKKLPPSYRQRFSR